MVIVEWTIRPTKKNEKKNGNNNKTLALFYRLVVSISSTAAKEQTALKTRVKKRAKYA